MGTALRRGAIGLCAGLLAAAAAHVAEGGRAARRKTLGIRHGLGALLVCALLLAAPSPIEAATRMAAQSSKGLLTEVEYSGTWKHTYKGPPGGSTKNPGSETVTAELTFTESVSLFTKVLDSGSLAPTNSLSRPVKVSLSGEETITYSGRNASMSCSASFFARSGLSGADWTSVSPAGLPLAYISVNERQTKGIVGVYAEAPGLRSSVHPEFVVRVTGGSSEPTGDCGPANSPRTPICDDISLITDPDYTPGDRGFDRPPNGFLHAVAKLDPHTATYFHPYKERSKTLSSCDGTDVVTWHSLLIVKNSRASGEPTAKPEAPDPKLVKLDAKLAARDDLRDALEHAKLPCAEAVLGAGVTLASPATTTAMMPMATIGALTTVLAGGICHSYATRIYNDVLLLQRKDPPLGRFVHPGLPGCGNLSGAVLSSCNGLRAAGASLIASAQHSAAAANRLDVAYVALGNAVRRHQQATITKEVPVVRRSAAELGAAAAAVASAQANFYRLIGQAGVGVRLTKTQSAAGIANLLTLVKSLGVEERVVRKYAGSALVPKAAVIVVPTNRPGTPSGGGKPTIASVTFGGSSANPSFVVHGTNLGTLPKPNPPGHPSGTPGCPVSGAGDNGYDYGTSLYIAVPARNWSGGRYRPSLNETDCIDLVVTKFTTTEVAFHFGSFYVQNASKYPLNPGDQVQVAVNGATKTLHVKYGATVSR